MALRGHFFYVKKHLIQSGIFHLEKGMPCEINAGCMGCQAMPTLKQARKRRGGGLQPGRQRIAARLWHVFAEPCWRPVHSAPSGRQRADVRMTLMAACCNLKQMAKSVLQAHAGAEARGRWFPESLNFPGLRKSSWAAARKMIGWIRSWPELREQDQKLPGKRRTRSAVVVSGQCAYFPLATQEHTPCGSAERDARCSGS